MTQTSAAPPDSAAYRERLRQLLPELRQIEGFPIGSDEDILALSDPPYYTACPNPFLDEFIAEHGTPYDEASDDYHREPFAADVSEGKNDPIYNAHSYHTKVPHKAIMRYILHYTKPGDIVFDGFCGSGMTGVAAQLCDDPDPEFKLKVENEWRAAGHPKPDWGARKAILCDLSPAATFIAYNYNTPVDVDEFEREAQRILDEVEAEYGWMYETLHTDGRIGRMDYVVWSAMFRCPECGDDINFVEAALDPASKRTRDEFPCPKCGTVLTKRRLQPSTVSYSDSKMGALRYAPARTPTLIRYRLENRTHEKAPDENDVSLLAHIEAQAIPPEIPDRLIPHMHMTHERARLDKAGVSYVRDFFLRRATHSLAAMWRKALRHPEGRTRQMLLFFFEQAIWGMSLLARYVPSHYSQVNQYLSGIYYVPAQIAECSPWYILDGKLRRLRVALAKYSRPGGSSVITTGHGARTGIVGNSVDYVFTDPPFGENIYYADLNFLVESWHRVWTNAAPEAIIDRAKQKRLPDYQHLMESCFIEFSRILKPGRWMTVVFHNSRNAVWNAIQEAIQRAGFVVADVRVLDKQQGSYRQMTSTAVKQDLVISAYKPKAGFEQRFRTEAGTEQGAWDFVRQHLDQLPIFVEKGGKVEVVAERQNYLLYDRMIAFHIQRGATIPLSAASFYAGLKERLPERDGMYFTEVQAAKYDRKRAEADDIEQLSIFVVDEKSAIQWLRAELATKPQTFQELQPKFLQELSQNRYEELPELRDLLEQNYLEDATSHRWRVPDPGRQADLEALRQRSLLAEFATYMPGSGKLKRFRLEAIRAGFADLWAKRDYRAIIGLADRLPDAVVQEDPAMLMYYDNAVTREGTG